MTHEQEPKDIGKVKCLGCEKMIGQHDNYCSFACLEHKRGYSFGHVEEWNKILDN
jgi:hypothetical protein